MLTSKPQSSSSSKVAGAFAGLDVSARLLPVAGFARLHAAHFPALLSMSALDLRVYLVLVLLCDGGDPRRSRRVRTEDLAELLNVTRRRVLLAIADLVKAGLVRRLSPGQGVKGGCQFAIVQPGENKPRSDHFGSLLGGENGSRGITSPPKEVIPPLPFRGGYTSNVPDRSEQTETSSSAIAFTTLPPTAAGGGGEGLRIPNSWTEIARRLFPACHSPEKFLRGLVDHGFDEETGRAYLERSQKARDLPSEDHRALAAWCSPERLAQHLERRHRERPKPVDEPTPAAPSADQLAANRAAAARARAAFAATVGVPVFTPKQLASAARAESVLEPDPTRGPDEIAKVAPERSSPEQTAFLRGTLDVAEGGKR